MKAKYLKKIRKRFRIVYERSDGHFVLIDRILQEVHRFQIPSEVVEHCVSVMDGYMSFLSRKKKLNERKKIVEYRQNVKKYGD